MARRRTRDGARPVVPVPALRLVGGATAGTTIPLDAPVGTIGRRADNTSVLDDLTVSRGHARISREAGAVIVTDLGSAGGTRVNGTTATGPFVLRHGDRITFGSVAAVFDNPAEFLTTEQPTEVFTAPGVDPDPVLSPRHSRAAAVRESVSSPRSAATRSAAGTGC